LTADESIAGFLNIPEVAWAYQLLALVPVIRGFEHFDIYLLNREMKFGPLLLTKTVPAFIGLLSIWPLYQAFDDYRIMLYSVLLHWVLVVATSHLVARRRYRANLDRSVMRRSLHFGWPIMITNILLFGVFQGDKLIVGREFGIETLAIFAMGITLTLTPSLVFGATEQQFYLPQLSNVANDQKRFAQLAMATMQTSLISGLTLLVMILFLGEPLVSFLLGEKYKALHSLLPWLAILQAIHTFKNGCITVAISQKHTSNSMIVSCFRILALILAWYVAASGGSLLQIIWIGTMGELCGYSVSLFLISYRLKFNIGRMRLPIVVAFALIAMAVSHTLLSGYPGYPLGWGRFFIVLFFVISLAAMRDFWTVLSGKGLHS